ncbi:HD domain-containing protein [Micromonospora sp. WMMA1363]|uniref:RelA/SpoT family protein n=1 Tax=Micromonospora sp. WMMA1363 TaxID=3053985 RepID=UPI00259D1D8E|nr:HD domain-containing protein [Micromonospora sp. WMMA1363]MDM4720054.1 HD domain-containing protein [Micromonospora sp. WMMA1363]
MDVDAGHGAALGGALPTQPGDLPLTRRLRSLLSWPVAEAEPVSRLVRTHRNIHSGTDPSVLRRAYSIAETMHRGQFRKSGEPYITHPLAVAQICADLGMDTVTLVAALLHDTVEDTRYTLQALADDFGREVAHLVDGVTKFDKAFYGQAAEAETIRKMIIAAGKDVRVLIIKLADRLHNMRTLGVRSAASRERIARKTQEVLVPLCDRLGIQTLKRELDDVVLLHLEPEEHARIDRHVHERAGWDAYLGEVVARARTALRRSRVDAEVTPRPRHLYSIWKDTVSGGHTVPYDLPRIAVVVDGSATDCYAALGAIHGVWRPVPGRFKDYIASPKNNLYRSLHTSVCGPRDHTIEVLIRTAEMHRSAEYGVATSYRFPRAGAAVHAEQLDWLRRVLDWEQETADPAQFLESLRCDLAEAQIQVFADGRQVVLPAGATPVDLAYELDTECGDHCLAARINGRLAPLSSCLAEGDVVEIFTETDAANGFDAEAAPPGPRREWLGFVKSPQAQMQINRWFADHTEPGISISDKVRLGRATIGLALRRHNRGLASDLPLLRLSEELGYPDLETMLVAVFDRVIEPDAVVQQLIDLVDHRQ